MRDISWKIETLRTARAEAVLRITENAASAIENGTVPKGDVFEAAKVAGYMAVKKTSDAIPHCHPLPIEATRFDFAVDGLEVHIEVEVKSAYKTGCEMEALYAASVAALTIYDMLKPIEKDLEVQTVRLLKKTGGKSDFTDTGISDLRAGVIVCSDSVSAGEKKDRAGKAITERLKELNVEVEAYMVIPDEPADIEKQVIALSDEKGLNLVILAGGTGLSPRDVTPEAVKPLLDTEIPGVMEAARSYGQRRTPYAMLSRGIAGLRGNTLILTFPGSTRGAKESLDALFPSLLHIFRIMKGRGHDQR